MEKSSLRYLDEILPVYLNGVEQSLWVFTLLLFFVASLWGALAWRVRRNDFKQPSAKMSRRISVVLLIVAMAGGTLFVLSRASLFDDAFISFRYARNFAEGNGLVFNVGERVEGYTNFLWTALIGMLIYVTGQEAPFIALILGVAAYLVDLWVVYRLGTKLFEAHKLRVYVPIAVLALALHRTFADYGTSGLETIAAGLFVHLGLLWLMEDASIKNAALSGAMFILSTFTRPDHAIFFIVGGTVMLWEAVRKVTSPGSSGTVPRKFAIRIELFRLSAFAFPFLLYATYLIWKLSYYGDFLPNTYYAKSAGAFYFSQGFIYATLFYLGSHFLLLSALFVAYLLSPSFSDSARRYKLFGALGFVAYNLYVLKVGGDFMYGRFYIVLLPVVLLGIEDWIYLWIEKGFFKLGNIVAIVFAVWATALCAFPVELYPGYARRWNVADEARFYRLSRLYPTEVAHGSVSLGKLFQKELYNHGIQATLSTHGLGILSYYAKLPVIDQHGLTDKTVAHQAIASRGAPGHEKSAPLEYLRRRKVLFGRALGRIPVEYRPITEVKFGRRDRGAWTIVAYQKQMLDRIKTVSKEIRFVDFPGYLDRYIAAARNYDLPKLERDLAFFNDYYFRWNQDDAKRQKLKRIIDDKRSRMGMRGEMNQRAGVNQKVGLKPAPTHHSR